MCFFLANHAIYCFLSVFRILVLLSNCRRQSTNSFHTTWLKTCITLKCNVLHHLKVLFQPVTKYCIFQFGPKVKKAVKPRASYDKC